MIDAYLYLDRCANGCVVYAGADDARASSSSLAAAPGPYTLGEFQNDAGQTGAAADAEWAEVVQCVRDMYSPYGLHVTDQAGDVPVGAHFTRAMIAGRAAELGLPEIFYGVAPPAAACTPEDNTMSFTFANDVTMPNRAATICSTTAQETARLFALSDVTDNGPLCDLLGFGFPAVPCYGDRFFRDIAAMCFEKPCACGPTQNAHQALLSLFGQGVSTVPVTTSITYPSDGATVPADTPIHVTATSRRGITRVELWLNGYRWATVDGSAATAYALRADGIPDSILDVTVKAFDDIGGESDAAMTITQNAEARERVSPKSRRAR